jgi:CheY-like chemotaxis protein
VGCQTAEPITVLVADDEEDMRVLVRGVLTRHGMKVVEEAIDGIEALTAIDRLDPPPTPSVLVLDNRMPALSGLEVAAQVLTRFPDQHIILFSAVLTPEIEAHAKAIGIRACLSKDAVARLPTLIADIAGSGDP